MSNAVHKIATPEVNSLTLAELFNTNASEKFDQAHFSINEQSLMLSSPLAEKLTSTVAHNKATESVEHADKSNVELVLFANSSVAQLLEIQAATNITINQLNAINVRNGLTSFRFAISSRDLAASQAQLVNFSLEHRIEAALIADAPSLSEPGLLVMDMDSTTIEIECIDEIAVLAGVGEQVAEVTELAMQGKLDFAQSLHQRVATLKDAPESILASVAKDIPLMAGLETLVEALKAHNWRVAIASGGFTYFSEHLREMLGLDATFANTLEVIDGTLTGKVLGDVVDAQAKADSLGILSERYGIASTQTVAMGDGANDLVMMNAANLGIAYKAKPIVLKQADSAINHSGLDCMLHWLA